MKNSILTLILLYSFSVSSLGVFAGEKGSGKFEKSQVKYLNGSQEEMVLNAIPRKTKSVEFNDQEFYCVMGNFYVLDDEKYVLVNPPSGLEVKNLCDGYERIILGGAVVYYANGIFYYQQPKQKAFKIIHGPVGAKISSIPENSAKAKINGQEYLVYFNTVFKATPTRSRDMYTLVGYIE